ncbi:putative reverse transcriptase domain-containing protein, partial [Tanacetum coccineum]
EEHADYPANEGDGDDEPSDDDSNDDTDDDEEVPFKDEDDGEEEEEHLAPSDSSAAPVADNVPSAGNTEAFETDESAPTPRLPQTIVLFSQTRLLKPRKTVRLEPPMSASMEAHIAEHAVAPTPQLLVVSLLLPLPSPLTTRRTNAGVPLGYRADGIRMRAASPPLLLPSTSHRTDIPEAEMPPQKRACFTTPTPGLEVGESSAADATRHPRPTLEADLRRDKVMETGYRITDTWDEIETKEFQVRFEDAQDDRAYLRARVNTLFRDRPYHRHTAMILDNEAMYACMAWTSSEDMSAAIKAHVRTLEAQQGVTAVLAKRDADKSINGDDSHDLGTRGRRQVSTVPTALSHVRWNSHVWAVGHDIAYEMPWKTLKKMMTDKYCPRSEIKKLETEMWNLKVKGTDVMSYNQRFQELALMCDRMFPEESNVVEKYFSGLPDMIHGSVKASKPKTMQEAIEFSIELMDKKILTITERQAENKRKFEDTSRNNQNQQQRSTCSHSLV